MSVKCAGNCIICGKCGNFKILDSFKLRISREERSGFGIAVDIGTTTVVTALVDLSSGKIEARHSFLNPQRKYGPDVITRIHAANEGHLTEMRTMITEEISRGIDTLTKGFLKRKIEEIVITGNTTMIYLLLGFPCESLGTVPFKPEYPLAPRYIYSDVFPRQMQEKQQKYFKSISFNPETPVIFIPLFAAFVGSDITAGLLYVMTQQKNRFMLIDLGTNGEMALYNEGKLIVTSTAAGPAFEGSVCAASETVAGASAVIENLANLLRSDKIDETGLLAETADENGDVCFFSQKQIRDLQLAKSAVRSGIEILLDASGLDYNNIDALYLAGGIGQAMNVNDAAEIGLIPSGLSGKTISAGNSSLGGAVRLLLSPCGAAEDTRKLLSGFREINLAAYPGFNDMFTDNMFFYR